MDDWMNEWTKGIIVLWQEEHLSEFITQFSQVAFKKNVLWGGKKIEVNLYKNESR